MAVNNDAKNTDSKNIAGGSKCGTADMPAGQATEAGREYLSVREVAEISGCSYGTVRRAIEAGNLAAYRIGRKFFIERQAAEEYSRQSGGRHGVEGYTIRELMERLSLSYAFISGLIKSGELPSVRVGRQYIVTEEAFRQFMEGRRI